MEEGRVDEALKLSQQHVDHSRTEPGCITHGVHLDSENPQRLVFVEQWENQPALAQHFKESTSIDFVKNLVALSDQTPIISVFDATQLQ